MVGNFDAVSASLLRRALSGAYLYRMTSASETVAAPQGRLFDCWGWRSMIVGNCRLRTAADSRSGQLQV